MFSTWRRNLTLLKSLAGAVRTTGGGLKLRAAFSLGPRAVIPGTRLQSTTASTHPPSLETSSSRLTLTAADGSRLDFPFAWLRDNCQCPECFHPISMARNVLLRNVPVDIRPEEARLDGEKNVVLTWADGHRSTYSWQWLVERGFTGENARRRGRRFDRTPRLWGAGADIKRHRFDLIMEDDLRLLDFLSDLELYGLTLVQGIPDEASGQTGLLPRLAFAKYTHYARVFEVEDKSDPNNLAYTAATLGLHTDLPYYEYVPGVQFLHCVRPHVGDEGGENEFCDGFHVARTMREAHPEEYRTLAETPVEFWDVGFEEGIGMEFHKVANTPTFLLDASGEVRQVNYNNQVRNSHLRLSDAVAVERLYRALARFDQVAYQSVVTHRMGAGECVAFDNRRVLHGRQGFTSKSAGAGKGRRLVGWYVDWDEIWSRTNVLRAAAAAEGKEEEAVERG